MRSLVSLLVVATLLLLPSTAYTATLNVTPTTGTFNVGSTIEVTIILNNSTGANVSGIDIDKLRFNSTLLEVIDFDAGAQDIQIEPIILSPSSAIPINSVDNTLGEIRYSNVLIGGQFFNVTTDTPVARIMFRTLIPGTATGDFDFVLGVTTDTNVASSGNDILTSVNSFSFIISGVGPATNFFPADGAIDVPLDVQLSWTPNVLTTNQDIAFGVPVTTVRLVNQPISVTTYIPGADPSVGVLLEDTTYSWRIVQNDDFGGSVLLPLLTFTTIGPPQCRDGIDNDGDGNIDLADPGCSSPDDDNEADDPIDTGGGGPSAITGLIITPRLEGKTTFPSRVFDIGIFNTGISTALINFDSTNADTSSRISIPDGSINPGTYDIRIASANYLAKRYTTVALDTNTNFIVPTPLRAGDLTNDGTINSLDWSLMNDFWGTPNVVADINTDGQTNSIDFSYLNDNWFGEGD